MHGMLNGDQFSLIIRNENSYIVDTPWHFMACNILAFVPRNVWETRKCQDDFILYRLAGLLKLLIRYPQTMVAGYHSL